MSLRLKYFVNNEFHESTSGKYMPLFNPSTGEQIGETPRCSEAEVRAAIEAADAAAKAASVTLVEIRIGRGMGAKAFFSFLGEVADVHAAAEAARAVVAPRGLLVDIAEITGPHPDLPMVVL